MKKNLYSIVSITISIICIIVIVKINYIIALVYKLADGKAQALFGIVEISYFYKYYYLLLGFMSFSFALLANRKHEMKTLSQIAFGLSIISIIIIFVRLWKLMV